jgi:hypothetical protein
MNFEENLNSFEKKELKKPDQNLVILNEQLARAIKQEDFEQAAVLRDLINKRKQDPALEFYKKDFIEPTRGGVYIFREDDPRHRAWKGMSERRQKSYWDGIEIVNNHELYEYLVSFQRADGLFKSEIFNKARKMREIEGPRKVDFMLDLKSQRNEMKDIVNMAEEKFNSVWLPYCEKNDLPESEYKEMYSLYGNEYQFTDKRTKVLNKIPGDIIEPLKYWQRVYDNSRFLLDDFDAAIEELER